MANANAIAYKDTLHYNSIESIRQRYTNAIAIQTKRIKGAPALADHIPKWTIKSRSHGQGFREVLLCFRYQ